jgi:hypothetical protein
MVHDQVFASEIHKNESAAKKSAHKEETDAMRAAKKEQAAIDKFSDNDPLKKYQADMRDLAAVRGKLEPETFLLNEQKIAAEFEKNTVDLKAYNDELERQKKYLEHVGDYNSLVTESQNNLSRGAITPQEHGLNVSQANAGLMNNAASAYPNAKIPNIPVNQSAEVIDKKNINESAKELAKFTEESNKAIAALDSFGNSGKMAFDGILGGISAVASAATSFSDEMTKLNNSQNERASSYDKFMKDSTKSESDKAAATKQFAKEKEAYDSKSFAAEISGARQVAGAASKMFSEKSAARKAFHAIEMGLAVVEMAMSAKKMIVDVAAGAASMFAQGGWAGFAGVAAMMAVMGGLGFAMSGGSGKTVDNTTPASKAEGTVLGSPTATSNSIDNIIKTLNDIHAQEYPELKAMADNFRGVDRDLYQMQRDLSLATANFTNMQSMGIPTSPTGAGQSKNPLGSTGTIAANLGASVALGATGALSTAGLYAGAALINAGATSLGIGISTAAASSATMAAGIGAGLGATGAAATMIGGAILGLAGGLILAAAQYGLGKLLGIGKVKYQQIGEGIVIGSGKLIQDGMATAVDAQTWRKDIQTIKGWFSDKKTVIETYGQLSDDVYNSLNSMTANLTYGMMNAAQQLGAWDVLSYKFTETASRPALKIDFWKDGKRVEDTNKVLTDQINAWMDRTATAVFGTLFGEYQKIGEGMMETVARLAGEVAVVKGSFAKMHLSVGDSNLGLVTFSDTLVQMYASSAKADDGLKNFVASMNDLYNFTMSKGQQSQDSIDKSKQFLGADFNIYDTDAVKNRTLEITTKIAEAQQKATDAEAKVKAMQNPVNDYWNPTPASSMEDAYKSIGGNRSDWEAVFGKDLNAATYETSKWTRETLVALGDKWKPVVDFFDEKIKIKAAGEAAGGSTQTIEQNQAALAAAQQASTNAAAEVVVLTNSLTYLKDSASATASLLEAQSKYLDLTQTSAEKTARERNDFIKTNLSGLKDDLSKSPYYDTFKPIVDAMKAAGIQSGFTAEDLQRFVWKLEDSAKSIKKLADATKYFDGFTQNIKSWVQNLKATQLGSPESQFNAAKDNFAAQMKIINGGLATSAEEKQVALSGITGVADTYIAAIRSNYASTKEGQDLISQVLEQVSGLTTTVDVQQLQLGVLQSIRDGVHALPTGISDTQKTFFESLATKIDTAQKTYIAAPTSTNDLIANTLAKEWTIAVDAVSKGGGFLDALIKSFDGDKGLNSAINLIIDDKSLNSVQAQTAVDNVLRNLKVVFIDNEFVAPNFLSLAQKFIDQQIDLINPPPIYLNANNDDALVKIKTTGEKLTAYNGINVNKIVEVNTTSAITNIKDLTKATNDAMSAIAALNTAKSTPISYPTALTPSDITNISPSISNLSALGGLTAANSPVYTPEMLQAVQPQLIQSPAYAITPAAITNVVPSINADLNSLSLSTLTKDPSIQAIIDSASAMATQKSRGGAFTEGALNAQNIVESYKANYPQYFAKGGAFTNGVVSEPTMFNMGVMGEAGSEFIMPAAEMPGGKLGVHAIMPKSSNDSGSNNNAETIKKLEEINNRLVEQQKQADQQILQLSALIQVMNDMLDESKKQAGSLDALETKTRIQNKLNKKVANG